MDRFINLGKSWDVTQLVNDTLQAFTCHMYASSSKTTKMNVLRHEMFLTKRGEVDSSTLLPCEDSLQQHIQRANYQAGVWQRYLQRNPDVPEPTTHGWVRTEDGSLKIDWMQGHAAPDALVRASCMSMQNRMFTRAVSLFGQWPQMHLYVPATDMWKSKRG